MATVLYPGSFDPFHLGHLDVVHQAVELFGEMSSGETSETPGGVIVAVMHNPAKPGGMFTLEQRLDIVREAVAQLPTVRVEAFPGLAVDAARASGAAFIVKGLRTAGDFEIEQQMAHTNHTVSGVRTVYVPCDPARAYISSRFIREIAQYGGDVADMVPASVARRLAMTPTRTKDE